MNSELNIATDIVAKATYLCSEKFGFIILSNELIKVELPPWKV